MTKPNILLIVSDQHRRDWVGCRETPWLRTPNLDDLAARGVSFDFAYCSSPLCGPSRMSMMTGRRPEKLGIFINEHSLSPDVPTMAHSIGLAGYETVLCGRMHFCGPDQRHGYQRRLAGDFVRSYAGGPITNLGENTGAASNLKRALETAGPHDNPVMRYDSYVTDCCEAFLAEREDDRPLFLTVGYYGPHHPWNAPPDRFEEALERVRSAKPRVVDPKGETLHRFLKEDGGCQIVSQEKLEEVRAAYAVMTEHVDSLIGRVMEAAKRLPGETLVVYVSDHGEMAGDHARYGKGVFYEASAGVPMIWASLSTQTNLPIPHGREIPEPVSLMDLPPTLTTVAGGPPLPLQDGVDLWPTIQTGAAAGALKPDRIISSHMKGWADAPPMRMVRKGRYKLNYYATFGDHELFDLENDPEESMNLWDQPEYESVQTELLAEVLSDWDPEAIQSQGGLKHADMLYLANWGREVGRGRGELWEPPLPPPGEFTGPYKR